MLGRGLGPALDLVAALGFATLAVATSARAQGDLDQGKSAAQLYASACASCHKSPQSVAKTKWFFGLQSFLREHYTSSSESAAILAAYLKSQDRAQGKAQDKAQNRAQEKASADPQPGSLARHTSQTMLSEPTLNEFGEAIPRPPADIPDVRR
jgi:cytochrome c553